MMFSEAMKNCGSVYYFFTYLLHTIYAFLIAYLHCIYRQYKRNINFINRSGEKDFDETNAVNRGTYHLHFIVFRMRFRAALSHGSFRIECKKGNNRLYCFGK